MKNFYSTFILVTLFILIGCQKDLDYPRIESKGNPQITSTQLQLGKKLDNPYSVTNMRKAYEALNLETKSLCNDESIINTTHYYIKFKPQNEEELTTLILDSALILYPYPLDYEIKNFGNGYYHDPEVPVGQPTYYYASVKKDHSLPQHIEWELLEELFIPDDSGDHIVVKSGETLDDIFVDSLVEMSLKLTGNEESDVIETKASGSWTPRGTITYEDDSLGIIGLEGIEVRAKRWFTTHRGYTDASGNYICDGTFKKPADYSFNFNCDDFKIRGASDVDVSFGENNLTSRYDYSFSKTSDPQSFFAATAYRATYHFYYKDIHGLHRPPMANFWGTQMKMKVFYENNSDANATTNPARRFMGGNMIKIYNPERPTINIYSTVIHELAHAAHWRVVIDGEDSNRNSDYNYADDNMCESWAVGVQWYLTKDIYPTYKGRVPATNYTNVVMDLLDTSENDSNTNGTVENITGYDIVAIQNALIGCSTWDEWKNNVKSLYTGNQNDVENLFDYWYNF